MQMRIRESIKRTIAEKMVAQSEPGYTTKFMGEYFAVDTNGNNTLDTVMYKGSNDQWNPWHDNAVAVPVSDLYIDSDCTFDPTPDDDLIGDMDPDHDPAYDDAYEAAVDLAYSELPETIEV